MTTKLVSGGNIKGSPAAVYTPRQTPVQLSKYRHPFFVRNRIPVSIVGVVGAVIAFIVLTIVNNSVGAHLSKVDVMTNTSDTFRAQSIYVGQTTETARLLLGCGIFAAIAVYAFFAIWLSLAAWYATDGIIILAPIFSTVIMIVFAIVTVVGTAPGSTNKQDAYADASNWLELQHSIPFDVSNYFYNLRSDDADTSFAHNVKVTDETGTNHTLTIAVGGANQKILTLRVKD